MARPQKVIRPDDVVTDDLVDFDPPGDVRVEAPQATSRTSVAGMAQEDRAIIESLGEQETVRVRLYQVPEDSTDKPLPDEFVQINGHGYLIRRGVPVDVPQSVYDVLEQANRL